MISLSTCTTVPSVWSWHITYKGWTYKGCRHAPCMFIIDEHFLYSFFLILEFLLWTSCPWPNHYCLTHVTHRKQKQKTHSCLSPSSWEASFDISLTWKVHINTCSYIDGTAVTTITLPFGLWLNTRYSVIVCGKKWLDKTVPGKKCLVKIQERKRNSINNNNNVHLSCAHQRPEHSHDTY